MAFLRGSFPGFIVHSIPSSALDNGGVCSRVSFSYFSCRVIVRAFQFTNRVYNDVIIMSGSGRSIVGHRCELVEFKKDITLRDEINKEEQRKAKERFRAALAQVRHKLQTVTDRPSKLQPKACSQIDFHEILRET